MSGDKSFDGVVGGDGEQAWVRVKVVPGASRNKVVGVLGDRLKLAVMAPPEAGKANKAVCASIAKLIRVPARDVQVTVGGATPQKTLTVTGLTPQELADRLGLSGTG